jgi:hypothetical protein
VLTRIDHVMICVPDLPQGIETYRRIGFDVKPGGVHPRRRHRERHRVLQGQLPRAPSRSAIAPGISTPGRTAGSIDYFSSMRPMSLIASTSRAVSASHHFWNLSPSC